MTATAIISESWDSLLAEELSKPYMFGVKSQFKTDVAVLCPHPSNIWNALRLTPFEKVRVVILGQSPYHTGVADGLAFSASSITPSLRVIFTSLEADTLRRRVNPNLSDWASQGVLLLNSVLTTTKGNASAHKGIGWEEFTGKILSAIAAKPTPVVFMLWGSDAKKLGEDYIIPNMRHSNHLIIKTIHPQAVNYNPELNFVPGFNKVNRFLEANNQSIIKWL